MAKRGFGGRRSQPQQDPPPPQQRQARRGSFFSACPAACGTSVYKALMSFHLSSCPALVSSAHDPARPKSGGGNKADVKEPAVPAQESMDVGESSERGGCPEIPETPMPQGPRKDALRARMDSASPSPMAMAVDGAEHRGRKRRLFDDGGQKFRSEPPQNGAHSIISDGAPEQSATPTNSEQLPQPPPERDRVEESRRAEVMGREEEEQRKPQRPVVLDTVTTASEDDDISDAETVPFIGSVQDSQGQGMQSGAPEEEDEVEESLEEERGEATGEEASRYDGLLVEIPQKSAPQQQQVEKELCDGSARMESGIQEGLETKRSLHREAELERALGALQEELSAGRLREKDLERALQAKTEECEELSRREQRTKDDLVRVEGRLETFTVLLKQKEMKEVSAQTGLLSQPQTPQLKRSQSKETLDGTVSPTQILSEVADIARVLSQTAEPTRSGDPLAHADNEEEATQLLSSSSQSLGLENADLTSRPSPPLQDSPFNEEFRRVPQSELNSDAGPLGHASLAPTNAPEAGRAKRAAAKKLFEDVREGPPAQPKTPQTFAMLQREAKGGLITDFLDSFPPAQGMATPHELQEGSSEPGRNLPGLPKGVTPANRHTTTERVEKNGRGPVTLPETDSMFQSKSDSSRPSEDDDDDDDDLPLSQLKTKKRRPTLFIDSDSDAEMGHAGTDHEMQTTPCRTGKRRRLVKLSQSQADGGANNRPDIEGKSVKDSRQNTPLRRSVRLKNAAAAASPLVHRSVRDPLGREEKEESGEDSFCNDDPDVPLESTKRNSLRREPNGNLDEEDEEDEDGFINDDPESANSGDENSATSEDESSAGSPVDRGYGSDESASTRRSSRGRKKYRWNFEGDLLSALAKNSDLCLRGLCALYRRQEGDEQIETSSKYRNGRGFDKFHASRASTIASFLLGDVDGSGPVVRTSAQVEERFGEEAVTFCADICILHSKQLFDIYQSKEDPFFPGT